MGVNVRDDSAPLRAVRAAFECRRPVLLPPPQSGPVVIGRALVDLHLALQVGYSECLSPFDFLESRGLRIICHMLSELTSQQTGIIVIHIYYYYFHIEFQFFGHHIESESSRPHVAQIFFKRTCRTR